MKTYTAFTKGYKSIKVKARSNIAACRNAARIFGNGVEFRVTQGGIGYDSGWQKWASIYRKVYAGLTPQS